MSYNESNIIDYNSARRWLGALAGLSVVAVGFLVTALVGAVWQNFIMTFICGIAAVSFFVAAVIVGIGAWTRLAPIQQSIVGG